MLIEMTPAVDPRPGRVPEQDLQNPRNLSAMAAEPCIVFGKIRRALGFFLRDLIYRQNLSGRRVPRGRDGWRPRVPPGRRAKPVCALWAAPRVFLLASVFICPIKNLCKFSFNSENIFRSNFLQRNSTKTGNWHCASCQ